MKAPARFDLDLVPRKPGALTWDTDDKREEEPAAKRRRLKAEAANGAAKPFGAPAAGRPALTPQVRDAALGLTLFGLDHAIDSRKYSDQ